VYPNLLQLASILLKDIREPTQHRGQDGDAPRPIGTWMDFAVRRDIMPTKKTVTVSLQEDMKTLGLTSLFFNDDGEVELGPDDWVEWNFPDAPSGTLPIIEFDSPLGPFQCLQSLANATVQGKGNIGEPEGNGTLYKYTAFLLTQDGVQAQSEKNSVRNLEQSANTSPVVTVTVTESDKGPSLTFEPETLMLYPGDTALWNVFGLSTGHFITFQFEPPPQDPDLDPLVGPFESLLANRRVGKQETNVMRVVAANFNPASNDISQYVYQVAVRDSEGNILEQHEPVIDNLGQPPS
jgi:plastocyanin